MEDKETDETPTFEQLNVSQAVKDTMTAIDTIVSEFTGLEAKHQTFSPEVYWALTMTWTEPIKRWLQGESATQICTDYGLFEGNFVRAVLRVANMVDEWTAVATFMEDVELLEKMNGVRQQLVRDFLVPDSLYLHL
jgi:superfamily II RNA helicase